MLPFEHEVELRARYAETDAMGVVWHGNYLSYFEVARTEAMRATGLLSYRALEDAGVMMPIVEIGITYHTPARYDDVLRVAVRVGAGLRRAVNSAPVARKLPQSQRKGAG